MKKPAAPGMATKQRALNGWSKETIQHLLQTNDRAVERALIQIYNRQTEDEQRSSTTNRENSVGFTAFDAEFLTNIAKQCIQRNGLTPGQVNMLRPKMMKYWRQLLEIASTSPTGPSFKPPAKTQMTLIN